MHFEAFSMNTSFRDAIRRSKIYYWLGNPINKLKGRLFDLRYGVHTAPEVKLKDLSIESPNARLGVKYAPTEPKYFKLILDDLNIDYELFTFIDFGSGMGRVLLLASEKPFRRIIGIEFSEELNEIAKKNIERFVSSRRKCADVEPICQDATTFKLPLEPSVFYFFNPFDRRIFETVIDNLEHSLAEDPRDAYVLYANPEHNDLFLASPLFEEVARGPWHSLHRAKTVS